MSAVIENEKGKVLEFFYALDEMIGGKFILADIKISKVLKCIADSETLYNLFAKSLVDFNFKQEFRDSVLDKKVNGALIALPEENEKIIAYVFHIFVEADNKKIDLQNFINEYFFNPDGYNFSYASFSRNMLLPFKKAIVESLDLSDIDSELAEDENVEGDGEENMEDEVRTGSENIKMLYAKLMVSLSDLYSAVLKENRIKMEQKEEVYIIVSALNEAIRIQNIKIINALIIPLEYVLKKNKNVRPYYNIVQDDLCEIYEAYQ